MAQAHKALIAKATSHSPTPTKLPQIIHTKKSRIKMICT